MDTNIVETVQSAVVSTVQNAIANEMLKFQGTFSDRLSRVEDAVFKNGLEISKHAAAFQTSAPKSASTQLSVQPLVPHPALTTAALHASPPDQSPFPSTTSQRMASEMPVDMAETIEEEEDGPPVNPGPPSIPVNHTTGAARLLLNPAISELTRGVQKDKIKNQENYPMLQEERRGLLRLFGRGEGPDRLPGYDRDPMTDVEGSTPTASDTSSDAGSPNEEWGQLGDFTPPGDLQHLGRINHKGMPDLAPDVVRGLVQSYLDNINNMHPIMVPAKLNNLVDNFLQTISQPDPAAAAKLKPVVQLTGHGPGQSNPQGFLVSQDRILDTPSNKRRRSDGPGDNYEQEKLPERIPENKPGLPFRTIGTAIVLLVMALGDICQVKGKIQDCARTHESENSVGSPAIRNGHQSPSGLQSSPWMSTVSGLPSPEDAERTHPRSRRPSVEVVFQSRNTPGAKPRNLDVIPGLKYFAFATDILGNQAGGNSLQHVHANILASLYHGQLARPLESHAYLHQACRSLQVILRP
jgi:hypothetical protein